MVDLSETQPDCERCGAARAGLLHERSELFLCRSCCAEWDDEHPVDTSIEEPKRVHNELLDVSAGLFGFARRRR